MLGTGDGSQGTTHRAAHHALNVADRGFPLCCWFLLGGGGVRARLQYGEPVCEPYLVVCVENVTLFTRHIPFLWISEKSRCVVVDIQ